MQEVYDGINFLYVKCVEVIIFNRAKMNYLRTKLPLQIWEAVCKLLNDFNLKMYVPVHKRETNDIYCSISHKTQNNYTIWKS
jgi:hypothetical protein